MVVTGLWSRVAAIHGSCRHWSVSAFVYARMPSAQISATPRKALRPAELGPHCPARRSAYPFYSVLVGACRGFIWIYWRSNGHSRVRGRISVQLSLQRVTPTRHQRDCFGPFTSGRSGSCSGGACAAARLHQRQSAGRKSVAERATDRARNLLPLVWSSLDTGRLDNGRPAMALLRLSDGPRPPGDPEANRHRKRCSALGRKPKQRMRIARQRGNAAAPERPWPDDPRCPSGQRWIIEQAPAQGAARLAPRPCSRLPVQPRRRVCPVSWCRFLLSCPT